MTRAPRHPVFAVCAPGLESLLAAEIESIGGHRPRLRTGGVSFDATTRQLYAVNLWSRIATRVVVRVAGFRARSFRELETEVRAIEWGRWLAPGAPVTVRATATGSQLYHTGAIVERVERFVGERSSPAPAPAPERDAEPEPGARRRGTPDQATPPPLLVVVRIVHDEVTISVDTSGDPLYKRGWRHETAKAPLRETLAAAMVVAAGWDGSTTLIDPLCGSGTIAIEAALLARHVPPGFGRSFAFATWPSFEPGTWASVAGAAKGAVEQLADAARPDGSRPAPRILARDRDAGAIAAAHRNAERAGVLADLDLARAAISDLTAPAGPDAGAVPVDAAVPGWILTNPPYGARIKGGPDLRDLYARFGDVVRASFDGWSVGMLVADPALAAHTRLRFEERWRATNGGIPVHFLVATP
jgi:putative N6-adenine-specific DNA methylase